MLLDILLSFLYEVVGMLFLTFKNHEGHLTLPVHINLKDLRTESSGLPIVKLFYKVNDEIQERVCTAVCIDAVLFRDKLIHLHDNIWKQLFEPLGRSPMS